MKFLLVLLLLFGVPRSDGQQKQKIEAFGHIVLKLVFPSYYNGYNKCCCKLYPRDCYQLFNSMGYTHDFLKDRVSKTEHDGWIEFKIWNVQPMDSGYYRCFVSGSLNSIYTDYRIEISEVSRQNTRPISPTIATIKPFATSREVSDTAGPGQAEDHSSHSFPWHLGLPLAVAAAITVAVGSLLMVVCCRVKAKKKCGEIVRDSLKHNAPAEMNSVVYTTVDFKPHQRATELYANLPLLSPGATGPDSTWSKEPGETVEYSTLAISRSEQIRS
ncbi:uncharacterized protein LOC130108363 [Lampris incognitus]|uniref:uncharacterized protein LOC130108363 n=1 Tax=Lampris incognitus TaxID=2546036 RepID=UPI0024B4F17F|nr:uncharacterized protein LOC130108363 [Lampris incognitus]